MLEKRRLEIGGGRRGKGQLPSFPTSSPFSRGWGCGCMQVEIFNIKDRERNVDNREKDVIL